eukprot:403330665
MAGQDLVGNQVVTRKQLTQRKEWLEGYQEATKNERPTVQEDCPNCDSDLMYYHTMQLRSADEGQTVFFECVKCGHQFKHNT